MRRGVASLEGELDARDLPSGKERDEIVEVESAEAGSSIVITSQPKNKRVEDGTKATFTVEASGEGTLTYQWETSTDGGSTWTKTYLSGYKTATLNFTAQTAYDGRKYRCVIKDSNGNTKTSDAAILSIGAPFITTQPKSAVVANGAKATFTIEATSDGTLTYQWETSTDGGSTWTKTYLSGYKTATLNFTAQTAYDGRQFRCVVKDSNGNIETSDSATLTIGAALEITVQPESVMVSSGAKATFTVAAEGEGTLTYQWETSTDNGTTWVKTYLSGYKTATLSFNAQTSYDGRMYRCIVKDSNGNSVPSNPATLTITPITITQQPESVTVSSGAKATFTVVAEGEGTLTYQWETSTDNGENWVKTYLSGYKTATLSFNAQTSYDGRMYRCIVKDSNGNTAPSDPATLSIETTITLNEVVYEITSDTTVMISHYDGSASTLIIPETVEGFTVTMVGQSAFEGNTELRSLDLPDTITVIGKRAFANCSNLSEMK